MFWLTRGRAADVNTIDQDEPPYLTAPPWQAGPDHTHSISTRAYGGEGIRACVRAFVWVAGCVRACVGGCRWVGVRVWAPVWAHVGACAWVGGCVHAAVRSVPYVNEAKEKPLPCRGASTFALEAVSVLANLAAQTPLKQTSV
jgi:hypothetical protein